MTAITNSDKQAKKSIWIVGASSGIGASLVTALDEENTQIFVSARNLNKISTLFPVCASRIIPVEAEIQMEDLIAEEEVVVTVSHAGYIKRNPASEYRAQNRGGKGKIGMGVRDEDFVEKIFSASTHDHLLFFTDAGKVYWLKVYQLPDVGRATKGKAIVNLLALAPDEKVTVTLSVKEFRDDQYIIMATRQGIIKKTELSAYSNPRQGGIIALTLDEGDKLIGVELTDGEQDIVLGTRLGLVIRFKERDVRAIGRTARGVRGINLEEGNYVIGMTTLLPESATSILTVTEKGYGKRTQATEYRAQSRAGKGVISVKVTDKNGPAVSFYQVADVDDIMMMTAEGMVLRMRIGDLREIGRNSQGVRLIDMSDDDRVVGVAKLAEPDEDSENSEQDSNAKPSGESEGSDDNE